MLTLFATGFLMLATPAQAAVKPANVTTTPIVIATGDSTFPDPTQVPFPVVTRLPYVTPVPQTTPVPQNTPVIGNTPVPQTTPVSGDTPMPSITPLVDAAAAALSPAATPLAKAGITPKKLRKHIRKHRAVTATPTPDLN